MIAEADAAFLLDASALLALLHREPGADAVAAIVAGSAVSAVNWSEVLQKAGSRGLDVDALDVDFAHLGLDIPSFDQADARAAADLWLTGHRDLSFADRACLATAIVRGLPVATADRRWAELKLPIPVRVIR